MASYLTGPGAEPGAAESPVLRSLQWILSALAAGVFVFAAVVALLVHFHGPLGAADIPPALQVLPALLMAGVLPVWLAFRGRAAAAIRRDPASARADLENGRVPRPWFVHKLVGGALVEGPALLAVALYLAGGDALQLGVAALGVVLLVLQIPTARGCSDLVERLGREARRA